MMSLLASAPVMQVISKLLDPIWRKPEVLNPDFGKSRGSLAADLQLALVRIGG